ncbi:MBL fold metallo-hydrolase [Paenibacillus sp. DYY-L-2]|uniref:MBL fold metallo-hydrolase n=1 Tax=Paenibacillus sp. DYY-L-2 TaxID=3447013 RepID=UPI003F4FF22B
MAQFHLLELQFEQSGQPQKIYPMIIQDGSERILVDCGYPGFMPLLEEASRRDRIDLYSITKLLLTHHDIDHVGTAAALKKQIPNLEIYASLLETPYIDGARKALRIEQAEATLHELSLEERKGAEQFIGYLQTVEPVEVDRVLQSGELVDVCGGFKIISTPGHTPGHISLYFPNDQTLIAGDAVVIEDGKLNIANPEYAWDLNEAVRSVERLQNYEISRLFCYHGGLFQGDVRNAIIELLQRYRKN